MVDDNMNENLDNKQNKKLFSTSETVVLVIISLIIGLSIGSLFNTGKIVTKMKYNDKNLDEFIKNYNYILDNYYEEIDKEDLINSAISGMMESLDDPHSIYFDESESNNFSISLDGSYKGIGIQIIKNPETGYMLITSIFKDSPAEKSGLKAGDMIISVDDNKAEDLTAADFSSIIQKGNKDEYKLKVLREEQEIEITLKREMVTLTSVTSKIYEEENKKIGYIYIGIFANNTYSQFKEELNKLEEQKINYLILDVRGNTGGHLTAVDNILELFLNKNYIKYRFDQNGKQKLEYATGNENKNYEIILLGDSVSASASEVLISGLKENLGCKFIGKKTYGKGTVQELVTLTDGTQYKITVKKWLTPRGNWINDTEGITPDIEVDLDSSYYETYEDKDDNQLQRALQYIKEK
jgi:carboxyl-terminal processing protease